MASSLQVKAWCRAVWSEGDKEEELTIPSGWIEGEEVRWPKKSEKKALDYQYAPEEGWSRFPLLKVKHRSGRPMTIGICVSFYLVCILIVFLVS